MYVQNQLTQQEQLIAIYQNMQDGAQVPNLPKEVQMVFELKLN